MKPLLLFTAMLALAAAAAQAQVLRVAVSTHIPNTDPRDQTGNSGAPMVYQVYDTLIERDSFSNPLTFKPGLATDWAQIAPTLWELNLREGVAMHDRTTLNTGDIAFPLNRMLVERDPEFATAWGCWFCNFGKVEVADLLTVRIHTVREDPNFETVILARLAGIVSKEQYDTLGFEDAALNPMGLGLYRGTELSRAIWP